MTDLTPFACNDQSVRVVMLDGEPWFAVADLCKVLGLEIPAKVVARLDDDQKGASQIHTPGGSREKAERERIGATIRTYREMRGYRPDEFASRIGISRPYLANIEAGRKPLTTILLSRIATELDVRQVAIVRADFAEAVA